MTLQDPDLGILTESLSKWCKLLIKQNSKSPEKKNPLSKAETGIYSNYVLTVDLSQNSYKIFCNAHTIDVIRINLQRENGDRRGDKKILEQANHNDKVT